MNLMATLMELLCRVTPSRTILNNCLSLISREQVGLVKYGTSLTDAKLSRRELLQHAREEALDLANYLEAEIHTQDELQLRYDDLRQRLHMHHRRLMKCNEHDQADNITDILRLHDTNTVIRGN